MANEKVNFAVVGFSQKEAERLAALVPGDGSPADKMSQVSAGLLRDLIKGGVMIPAECATRIESAIETLDPMAIVEAVEKSAGRSGEATIVTWKVDPTQIQYYQELAASNNISLDQHLKNVLDYAHMQGWINNSAPDPFKLLLNEQQYRTLQERLGQDVVTGADVVNLLDRVAPGHDFGLDNLSAPIGVAEGSPF